MEKELVIATKQWFNSARPERRPRIQIDGNYINKDELEKLVDRQRVDDARYKEWLKDITLPEPKPLSLNEYQILANVTRNNDLKYLEALTNYGLGITGEAGEVADIIKKGVFHGHKLDRQELIKELGDVLWYIATLSSTLGVSLEEVACNNIDKLRKRYPEGFNQSKSVNRVE